MHQKTKYIFVYLCESSPIRIDELLVPINITYCLYGQIYNSIKYFSPIVLNWSKKQAWRDLNLPTLDIGIDTYVYCMRIYDPWTICALDIEPLYNWVFLFWSSFVCSLYQFCTVTQYCASVIHCRVVRSIHCLKRLIFGFCINNLTFSFAPNLQFHKT